MAKSWLFVIFFAFSVDVSMQVPCPTGWKDFGSSCYLFVLHTLEFPSMTWEDSRSYCKAFGGELVSITNSSEVDFIYNQTKSMGNHKFWIGLYRNKTTNDPKVGWVWSDGSKFTNPEQWRSFEPNDYLKNEKCAELFSKSKHWNDNNCKKQFSSICERGKEAPPFTTQNPGTLPPTTDPPTCDFGWVPYNRSCYKFENAWRTWYDAKRACRDTGGHLVKIDNGNEQRFLAFNARSSYQSFWIGLNDLEVAGRYVWESDKKSVSYTNWQAGEPNGLKKVHCVEMYGYVQAGFWNDEWCTTRKRYICEKEEGKNMCPENWVSYNDSCYQFNLGSSQQLSWSAAKNACSATGGSSSLVTIKSKEEQDFITKQVQAFTKSEVWIGLSDIGSETTFKWDDGSSLTDTKFSMWANVKPTENKEDKDCVLMIGSRIDGAWSVQSCTLKRNFICIRHRDLSFCNVPLGMENGNIRDSQITASSSRSLSNGPEKARFNRGGSWCPAKANEKEYLQIDLGSLYDIKKLLIEGNVTTFSIRYGKDGKQYRGYTRSLLKPIRTTPIILNSLTARFVQIYPNKWTGYPRPCLRLEFIGCPAQVTKTTACSGPNWEKGPGNLCYQINKSYRSWTDARSTCLDQGGDLLSIRTVEEKNAITKRIRVLTGVRSLWISLNDRDFEAVQYWSNNEDNSLFNWGSGNPPRPYSDASLLRSCVEIKVSSGTWNDISCNSRRPYICMKRDDTPTWGNVVNDGFTGVWMGSSKYYWPLSSVDNNIVLGTKLGIPYGKIISTTGVKNMSNTALQFSGIGSYIDAGSFTKECLTFPDKCTNGLTISFMASFDSNAVNWQNVKIFDSVGDQSNSAGLAVYVDRQYLYFGVYKAHQSWTGKTSIVGDKAWRHYIMRWNESGLNIYINAQVKDTKDQPQRKKANVNGKKNKFYIGIQSKPQNSGKLNMAMVAFWERKLTEKDILSIYRAEFGRCPFAWREYGMSCYQFQPLKTNFRLARKACQSLGGDLVNIASSVEQSFVMQNTYENSWIGVHDSGEEGVFKETNDDVIKFSNWNGGEPNDVNSEDCTEILSGNGLWNDMPCYWSLPYICEKQKDLVVRPPNASISKAPKFERICHYSRSAIGCPAGLVIKINSAFWGRRRKDVCAYISLTNCGLDKTATTTKDIQHQCDNVERCELHASETETYLSNPCPGVRKYLEVNYSCIAKTAGPSSCPSGWKVSRDKRACYRLFDTPKNWTEAKATCQSNKADLVSIATSLEQSMATSLMERAWYANVWTGLNDLKTKGLYQWSDGTPVTLTNWYVGQPDERRTDKSCVFMSLQRTKRGWMFWRDTNCSNTFAFMCKRNIGSQQKPTTTPVSTASCGPGLMGYSDSPYCYKVINQQLTWPAAKLYCKKLNMFGRYRTVSQLASIDDAKENEFIRKLSNDSMWIGLDARGVYRGHAWIDGKPVSYTNWDIGQPDSYNGLEACVQINPDGGYWSDVDCFTMKSFVCKGISPKTTATLPPPTTYPTPGSPHCKQNWTLFNGMCYFSGNDSYPDQRTWHDAELTCQSMNGHLASIKSDTETRFLQNLMKNKKSWNYWIGLNDLGSESHYEWVDGTGYGSYINWDDQEPNDFRRQEDCIQMRRYNGKWNDQHCSWKMSYICKSYNESYHPLVTTVPPRPDKDGYCAPGWIANGRWCYEFHTDPSDYRTWWDAKDACEKGHNSSDLGELVSISDEFEEAFITVNIKGAKAPLWTGMNSNHGWRRFFWADNSPANYFKWNTNEPRSRWSSCVEIVPYHWAAGRWNSVSCYRKIGYICKTATQKTPITATPAYTPTPTAPPSFKCPEGYKVYEESCYKFVNNPKIFDDARKTCNNEKAELMSVDSQFEQAYLVYLLERFIGSVWIGLLHKPYSVFTFTDNSSPIYTYWGPGQPNRQLGQRSCTQANITGSKLGLWDDVDCVKKNPFVCQIYKGEPKITIPINSTCPKGWRQYHKFCYKHFDNRRTWAQAQYACNSLGSDLISIHNDQEQDFLIYYYQDRHPIHIWTGLNDIYRERGYQWVDKSALNYVNWYPNEPNDHNAYENCVTMQTRNGQWNDLSCSRWLPYMCKHKLECSSPLSIKPSMITVTDSSNSTSLGASQAIINDNRSNEFAWCTNNTSGTAKITVDLNRLVQLTKISIQGRRPSGAFVKSFRIHTGEEGYWKLYTFSDFQSIIFGNLDSNNVVTKTFERPITLDSISITPVTWAGQEICMKLLLHGCDYVCQTNLIRSPVGAKDDFITAKSSKYLKSSVKIQASPSGKGWCAKSNDKYQWIQVNFDKEYLISKIRTYGNRKDSFVKSYKIQFSDDGLKWNDYQQHGHVRIFNGNNEATHPLVHVLSNTIEATYIRILPLTWNNNICMRFTLHGCKADCGKALLQKEENTDVTFSSSDKESHPEYALFNSGKAWCTKKVPLKEQYLQIDLGKKFRLTKIATQGSPLAYGKPRQVFNFTIKFNKYRVLWKYYLTSDKRQIKVFTAGNSNNSSKPVTNTFHGKGFSTRRLRIFPNHFEGTEICMRVELYGCSPGVEIIPTTPSTQQDIVDVSVRFTSIEWDEKLNDKESEQFKTVSGKIVKAVRIVYKDSESFRDVQVQKLSKGSVIALLKMKFNPAFNENKTQLLKDAVKSGKVGSLDVDKESFKIIDLTPQARSSDKSSGLSGGAVAGVVITVLFVACLVGAGGFLYYRQRKRKQLFRPQHFDNPISYSSKAYDVDE